MIIANPKYKELYNTDKRYILITGGSIMKVHLF